MTSTIAMLPCNLSNRSRRAIEKYGHEACKWAYQQNRAGEGPSNIAQGLGLRFNQANAAIDAGRELAQFASSANL